MSYNIVEIKSMQENTREELDRYLADVCQVVRDKDIKNPHALTDRLLKESYGSKPSSVFAFIPCVVCIDAFNELNTTEKHGMFRQFFGFFDNKEGMCHTNLRELLNFGMSLDEALLYVDFTHYKAFTTRVCGATYNQIRTHTQINFLSFSSRYSDNNNGYYIPEEVSDYFWSLPARYRNENGGLNLWWKNKVENTAPNKLIKFMKDVGVKRKEIYNRGADMLRIRPFSIGFNTLNPNSWEHFYNQRALDSHTQLECRTFVKELAKHVRN